jgi:HPt (histidine-containing phosphotransfer) domain-containing protein
MPFDDVLDADVLGEIAGMGCDGLKELVDLYLTQADETVASLRSAFQTDAVGEVAKLAHKLAGSSAACGARGMMHALRTLEQRAKNNQLSDGDRSLTDVVELLELSRRSFARYTSTNCG